MTKVVKIESKGGHRRKPDWIRVKAPVSKGYNETFKMMRDLNQMLQERMQGGEPDFDGFMQKYGDLFGQNPPQSLDELVEQMQHQVAQMQNLLDSLPADMRQQLQDLLMGKIADPELRDEMSELAANLEFLSPQRDMRNQYPFRGEEEIDLSEAMQLMGDMQDLDELERQLERTQYGGDIDDIDMEKLRELLGEEAAETLDELKKFLEVLEESGYMRKRGNSWELTPRGTRKIGQAALGEIYTQLKKEQADALKAVATDRSSCYSLWLSVESKTRSWRRLYVDDAAAGRNADTSRVFAW